MQHLYGHGGNLGTNVLTMPLHLAHLDSSRAIMPPHAGFVVTLTLLYVSMGATASVKLLNDSEAHSNKHRDITLRQGLAWVLLIVFLVSVVRSFRVLFSCVSLALSSCVFAFSGSLLSQLTMDCLSASASTASNIDDDSEHNQYVESFVRAAFPTTCE